MPMKTDDPLPDLLKGLKSRLPLDRIHAAKDLGRLGWLAKDALPALVFATNDEIPKVRERAAHAIGQMGPEALPALTSLLFHEDKYVRRNAIWALGKLGPLSKPVIHDICAVLKDEDPRTASGAAQALGNMGSDGTAAIPYLAESMRGTNIVLCRLAAKALSQIGIATLPTLISHLQHPDPFVRGESALALGWMGTSANAAVPHLASMLRGKNNASLSETPAPGHSLTPTSALAIGMAKEMSCLSGTATPTQIAAGELSVEDTSRLYAAQALGRMGAGAQSAVRDLQLVARVGPTPLREAAKLALRQIENG